MKNCYYCGDYHFKKKIYCSRLCQEMSQGKYQNIQIVKCKDKNNYHCECSGCLKAIFIQETILPLKEAHKLWIMAREII